MYTEIHTRHTEMLQQLSHLYSELTEEVEEFQRRKNELFTREIVEPLTHMLTKQKQVHPQRLKTTESWLQSLESKIQDITESDLIHIDCNELKLNGEIRFTREYPYDETETTSDISQTLNLQVVKAKAIHNFPLKTSNAALAASPNYILAFEEPSTLLLFDTKNYLRTVNTEAKMVWDICWSDTMKLFLIAGKNLQTYDIISNNLADVLVYGSQKQCDTWSVTTCFHDILVLYNGGGGIERYSWPSFILKTKWSESTYLESNDDLGAACIRLNNMGVLAVSIKQSDFHWRIDLFDTHMRRTHRGVSLTNYAIADLWDFPFISLNNHEWLVIDLSSMPETLLLFDKNGQLKQEVGSESSSLAQMGKNFLVLRKTTGLYLYKLPQVIESKW